MTDKEKYYDEQIAPKLKELAADVHEHGLSFLAVVEIGPNDIGRTAWMQESHGLSILMADMAARCKDNVDAFWLGIQQHAREHGHSSCFLHMQGIPENPNKGPEITTTTREIRDSRACGAQAPVVEKETDGQDNQIQSLVL